MSKWGNLKWLAARTFNHAIALKRGEWLHVNPMRVEIPGIVVQLNKPFTVLSIPECSKWVASFNRDYTVPDLDKFKVMVGDTIALAMFIGSVEMYRLASLNQLVKALKEDYTVEEATLMDSIHQIAKELHVCMPWLDGRRLYWMIGNNYTNQVMDAYRHYVDHLIVSIGITSLSKSLDTDYMGSYTSNKERVVKLSETLKIKHPMVYIPVSQLKYITDIHRIGVYPYMSVDGYKDLMLTKENVDLLVAFYDWLSYQYLLINFGAEYTHDNVLPYSDPRPGVY